MSVEIFLVRYSGLLEFWGKRGSDLMLGYLSCVDWYIGLMIGFDRSLLWHVGFELGVWFGCGGW